ncbi:hypothetical protein AAC387_Pa07g2386 [Persea americana]
MRALLLGAALHQEKSLFFPFSSCRNPSHQLSRLPKSPLGASSVAKSDGFTYYIGLQKHKADPYHASGNLDGIIQLGLVENQVVLHHVVCFVRESHIQGTSISSLVEEPRKRVEKPREGGKREEKGRPTIGVKKMNVLSLPCEALSDILAWVASSSIVELMNAKLIWKKKDIKELKIYFYMNNRITYMKGSRTECLLGCHMLFM